MKRTLQLMTAVILLLSYGGAAQAAPETPTGFLAKTHKQGDKNYNYMVYVPRSYDAAKKYPVIVFLHGAGECGTDGTKQVAQGIGTAILFNNDRWPYIVVFPQKPSVRDAWEDHDDAVMGMLKATQTSYSTDPSRVYLTGLSQGGHGTWYIGANHPDVFAAIAPICGYGDPEKVASKLKKMPIWCFHGDADTAVPLKQSQGFIDAIKAEGGTPKLTIYPGVGHNSWDKAYREEKLWDWFLQYTLK